MQGRGQYTLATIAPDLPLDLGRTRLTLPAELGIGWGGFYHAGSGNRLFGDVGLQASRPIEIGGVRLHAQARIVALIRDNRLRRLSAPYGETSTVVPLAMIGLSYAY